MELDVKLRMFAKDAHKMCNVHKILVFGSFIRKDLNEGSDIDIIIVGDCGERFHKRIAAIMDLADLPIEPLCYTLEEFKSDGCGRELFHRGGFERRGGAVRCISLSVCGGEASDPGRGGKWRSVNFAPGKRTRGILMFMSRTYPRYITGSGGGMSFRSVWWSLC
ncbi:MAG: nucleotidyltransferase domain-containing protein [Euryarchaeota archaeon]|nr:nucleotidyltransferase domain-containing protein [Euryarchaeota archaeon]